MRGINPAPAGFAQAVSNVIRTRIVEERQRAGSITPQQSRRWAALIEAANGPEFAGDADPRIAVLQRIQVALHGPGASNRWTPGEQQLAVLSYAANPILGDEAPPPTGEQLLNALLFGALSDLERHQERQLSRARKAADRDGTTVEREIEHWRERAQRSERTVHDQLAELERAHRFSRERKDELKALRRDLGMGGAAPSESRPGTLQSVQDSQPAKPAPVEPQVIRDKQRVAPNVYARTNKAGEVTSYQVDIKGIGPKGGFKTQQEAEQWRDEQLAKRDAAKRTPDTPDLAKADPALLRARVEQLENELAA